MKNNYLFIYIFILAMSIVFFPSLCLFFSILFLLLEGYSGSRCRQTLFYLSLFSIAAIIVNSLSVTTLISSGDDFVAYYNNYLYFLSGDINSGMTQFGNEIGVPLINYFLSIFIDEPWPYIVKLSHLLLIIILVLLLINEIKIKYKLQIRDVFILMALTFLFFKFQYIFLMLRQGYASIFVCFALFSTNKRNKIFFLLVAMIFHFSSIIVYFLCQFIIFNSSEKKYRIFFSSCVFLGGAIFFVGDYIQVITQWNIVLHKLSFAFNNLLDTSNIMEAIKVNILGLIYFLPLLVISIYKNRYLPIISIVVFVLTTSYIPGFSFRVIMPLYGILLGYLYFDYIFIKNKIKNTLIIFILFDLLLFGNVMLSASYYQRYPLLSTQPCYYIKTFFYRENININRAEL
ncbi:EpsG family protein [Photobacterium damselae subsp. damselae]|uniref:EpsG family protein n=1 Tax=Photobacterium damselae TaxID=38293 RepID=UPI00083A3DAB|nr:EpsG family protein [Photobacterium damselae]QSH58002.1 EpsG family protein [Photobacterium damselae subsp. damselae]